jgi:hypothetical protein
MSGCDSGNSTSAAVLISMCLWIGHVRRTAASVAECISFGFRRPCSKGYGIYVAPKA